MPVLVLGNPACEGGLELFDLTGAFQSKPSHDSTHLHSRVPSLPSPCSTSPIAKECSYLFFGLHLGNISPIAEETHRNMLTTLGKLARKYASSGRQKPKLCATSHESPAVQKAAMSRGWEGWMGCACAQDRTCMCIFEQHAGVGADL